jgi:hypothetical protein
MAKTKPTTPTLESIGIEHLIPYANNARKHSDEQVAQIAASIREFGFNNPVLVDADNGIIAGHGRVLAARKLGMTLVPVIRLSHLTDAQKRAYILADNRLAETGGGWDEELLRVELVGLSDEGEVDPALIGWTEDEIKTFLAAPDDIEDGFDATPDKPDEIDLADTMFSFGQYRFPCERDQYLIWQEALRNKIGFDNKAALDEIKKRLGL